jgi:hypothetical protein
MKVMTEDDLLAEQETKLKEQLQKVRLAREEIRLREETLKSALVATHCEALLALVPEHSGRCSDTAPTNGYADHGVARCTRCALLNVRSRGYSDFTAEVVLRSTFKDDE